MARNFIQKGETLDIVAAANLTSGTPIAVGALAAIPLSTVLSGQPCAVRVEGVFQAPKVAGTAFTVGQRVNFRPSANAFTLAAATTGDLLGAGVAVAAAASGDTTCQVRLSPGVATIQP
jgi:predicted RecA/RadA family phage recombinase